MLQADSPSATKRLSLLTILAFAGPSLPLTGMATIYSVYLAPYLTGVLGVGLAALGAAFLAIQVITLFLDPVLGWAMDRTRTRLGRFRPWTLASVPIFIAAVYMIFMARPGIDANYLIVWGLLLTLGGAMLGLSQSAWGANLASTYNERSRLYGVIGGVGGVGAILFLLLQVIFARPHPGLPNNIQMSGWIILVFTPLTVALLAVVVREPVSPTMRTPFVARDYWEMIWRPEMRRLILADFALALGPGTTGPLYLFFFRDALGFTAAQEGELLMIYVGAAFLGGPMLGWLATKLNKHRTLMLSTVGYAICQASLFVIPRGMFIAAVPGMLGCGFIAAGFTLLVRAMVADVGDEVRLEQGKERMSLLYSLVTTTSKVGGAITLPITYGVLAYVGYKPAADAVNTSYAIHGLMMCYIFAPIVFVLAGGLAMLGYKLDAKRHADVRAKLDLRDAAAGGALLIDAMTRSEVLKVAVAPKPG
jgi:GPH family glycoside/pentoside/hexuronide:cation symporter